MIPFILIYGEKNETTDCFGRNVSRGGSFAKALKKLAGVI